MTLKKLIKVPGNISWYTYYNIFSFWRAFVWMLSFYVRLYFLQYMKCPWLCHGGAMVFHLLCDSLIFAFAGLSSTILNWDSSIASSFYSKLLGFAYAFDISVSSSVTDMLLSEGWLRVFGINNPIVVTYFWVLCIYIIYRQFAAVILIIMLSWQHLLNYWIVWTFKRFHQNLNNFYGCLCDDDAFIWVSDGGCFCDIVAFILGKDGSCFRDTFLYLSLWRRLFRCHPCLHFG